MKKIFALLIIALLTFAGCFDDGGSDDKDATLKVTVNYTGLGTVSDTNRLYLAAFQMERDAMTAEEVRVESIRPVFTITAEEYGSDYLAESIVNNQVLTLNIPAGTYYLIAMWEHQRDLTKNYLFRKDSEYVIYNNVNRDDPTAFTPVVLTSGEINSEITMTINGAFKETGG